MDINTSLEGLRSLLGLAPAETSTTQKTRSASAAAASGANGDRAVVSAAGSEVSLAASEQGVRADKVASIQSVLASGAYNVPASAVASKVVDAMLGVSV